MKLKRVVGWSAVAIPLALVVAVLVAYWMSGNTCDDPSIAAPGNPMKAIVYCDYGTADVLKLEDVEKPAPKDDQVLVRFARLPSIHWTGTTCEARRTSCASRSGLRKPKVTRLGVDFAGTVEAVGRNVTQFKPGDDVFGGRTGAFAEYVLFGADRAVVLKPANLTFEQAAAVPIAAITALQGLRDKGKIQPGQKVLINGASGGVGTFAVQIAKSFGADVTGVCSTQERGDGPIARRRSGHRLHEGGFHQERATLRRHSRQRREPLAVGQQARPESQGQIRHDRRRRTERRPVDRALGSNRSRRSCCRRS